MTPTSPIPSGWVKLHRQIQQSSMWMERPFDRARAWVDLLLLANFTDGTIRKRGIKVAVKRGQVGLSERELADRWGWSRGKVRRFLWELEMVQQIEPQNGPQKNNVTSLITITNYDQYQKNEPQNGPGNSTTNGPQTDHRMPQHPNLPSEFAPKKVKKVKNITLPAKSSPADSRLFSDWFCYAFERVQGYAYAFEGGKDGKLLSEMLKRWPCKELVAKACHFFTDEDRFPKTKAPTIAFLKSKINDYPNHINGKADHFRELGILPPDGTLLEDWRPWNE